MVIEKMALAVPVTRDASSPSELVDLAHAAEAWQRCHQWLGPLAIGFSDTHDEQDFVG